MQAEKHLRRIFRIKLCASVKRLMDCKAELLGGYFYVSDSDWFVLFPCGMNLGVE
jgi:hypothetical protein